MTRLIKSTFPKVTVQKKMSSGKSENEYLGLSRKIIFMSPSTSEQSLLDMSGINPEIEKLKREIHNINEELDNVGKSLENQFDTETKDECILILFQRYNMLVNKKTTLQNTLERIYEMELGRLTKTAESGKFSVVESIELEK